MITCDICFEEKLEKDLHYMECLHYLCDNCFVKLKVNTCPFCRLEIYLNNEKIDESEESEENEEIQENVEIILPISRVRNRSEIRRNKKERKRRILLKFLEE